MSRNDIWRENNNHSLRVAFWHLNSKGLKSDLGGFNPLQRRAQLAARMNRAVLIAMAILVEGETVSSSPKAGEYKAPVQVRGTLLSDGSAWKETLDFVQVLPGF